MKQPSRKILCVGLVGAITLLYSCHRYLTHSAVIMSHHHMDLNLHNTLEERSQAEEQRDQPQETRFAPPSPLTSTIEHLDTASQSLGYVLTLMYTGQMVAGMRGIASQQCWLNSFMLPMSIVEPCVETDRSALKSSPELWRQDGPRLSNYHSLRDMNLSSWDTFLRTAPRKMIVVQVRNVQSAKCLQFPSKGLYDPNARVSGLKCDFIPAVSEAVDYLKMHGFEVVHQVCIDCSKENFSNINPRYFGEFVLGDQYRPHEVTILFDAWRFSFKITAKSCPRGRTFLSHIAVPPSLDQDVGHYLEVVDKLQNNTARRSQAA